MTERHFTSRILTLVLLLPLAAQAQVAARHYEAPLDGSHWNATGTPLKCRLSHAIPGWGEAVFTRPAGGTLSVRLESDRSLPVHSAQVVSQPPPWKHNAPSQVLGQLHAAKGAASLAAQTDLAGKMLASLKLGMSPTVYYPAAAGVDHRVSVALSTVNFTPSLEKFTKCGEALLPQGFDALRRSTLHFGPDRDILNAEARHRLDLLASWVKLDRQVARVRIDGYSDASGSPRDNYLLSKARALAVRRYLLRAKVPAAKIHMRYHGQRQPAASNATAEGRARNRRVVVQLIR